MNSQLILFDPSSYHKNLLLFLKQLPSNQKSMKICYVTLNKTSSQIIQTMKENNLESKNFHFLDAVTKKLFQVKANSQCTFIDLDDMSSFTDALLNVIKLNKIRLVILDSLSSLLVYKQDYDVVSFLEYIWPYFDKLKVDSYFFALSDDKLRPSIKQAEMMVTNTIWYSITR